MRTESSEKRLITTRRAMHRAGENVTAQDIRAEQSNVLDIAFEDYTRVDVGVVRRSSTDGQPQATKSLVADIAAQLDALDQQRQKLADLLRNISL
jgi:hypothetical protein